MPLPLAALVCWDGFTVGDLRWVAAIHTKPDVITSPGMRQWAHARQL